MHEILTLQFGQKANYLATHFWNIQESYFTYATIPSSTAEPSIIDHDIHFRPGISTVDGSDTYTPRTVIYDLKGGFGGLGRENALYGNTSRQGGASGGGVWKGEGVTTIRQAEIGRTQYQRDLDEGLPTRQLQRGDVRYWSDFNRVYFHPRSIVQLSEYSLNDGIRPFENYSAGEELFEEVDRESGGILDRDVRLWVEECDGLQGFQVFGEADSAWGGWMGRYLDALRDEFGKKSVVVWGVEEGSGGGREKRVGRCANAARTLGRVAEGGGGGYVRLGMRPSKMPGYINGGGLGSEWESTAFLAAAVESVTLPTRLRGGSGIRGTSMADLEQVLSMNEGRNVWDLGLKINWQDPKEKQVNGQDERIHSAVKAEDLGDEDDSTAFDIDFTPDTTPLLPNTLSLADRSKGRKHVFAQIDTSRRPKKYSNGMVQPQSIGQEELLRRRYNEEAIVERFAVPLGFPRLDAYPADLFNPPEQDLNHGSELSLSAGFTTSSLTKQKIFDMRDLVTRYSRVVAVDEREDLYNGLTEVGEKYAFGWDSGDESEDD